jgi:putative ABC transport system permease protein
VSTDYFDAFGIRLHAGRPFDATDTAGSAAVTIVNEALAAAIAPDDGVLGTRIRAGIAGEVTIVGVAADLRSVGLRVPPQPEVMVPLAQHPRAELAIVVAAAGDVAPSITAMRSIVRTLDPDLPVASVRPMTAIVDEQMSAVRIIATLLAALAGLALLLAAAGLSGLMARLVAERTQEIGIRAALGATRRDLVLLVMRDAARLVAWGALLGVPAAGLAARLASSALWGVKAADFPTFAAVPAVLALAALAACYVPARRASRVDPAAALRAQ